MSPSASPSRRHCRCAAIFLSFNVWGVYMPSPLPVSGCQRETGNSHRLRNRGALEEAREVFEMEGRGDLEDETGAGVWRIGNDRAQRSEGGARLQRPRRSRHALARAAAGEVVTDDAEEKVVADEVRAGQEDQED